MPDGNDPHGLTLDSVKEAIWSDDHLTKREFGEFRDESPGFRKLFQARESLFCFLTKVRGSRRVVPVDVGKRFKKLPAARRGEENSQGLEISRKLSASFKTSSSS